MEYPNLPNSALEIADSYDKVRLSFHFLLLDLLILFYTLNASPLHRLIL